MSIFLHNFFFSLVVVRNAILQSVLNSKQGMVSCAFLVCKIGIELLYHHPTVRQYDSSGKLHYVFGNYLSALSAVCLCKYSTACLRKRGFSSNKPMAVLHLVHNRPLIMPVA